MFAGLNQVNTEGIGSAGQRTLCGSSADAEGGGPCDHTLQGL